MTKQRRTKKKIILEDYVNKISSGSLLSGSEFPCAKEMTGIFGISQRTASSIIRELSLMGLLETRPGRRSRVSPLLTTAHRPKFKKPIGIISPGIELLPVSQWREWMLHHLQKRLLNDGFQSLWLSENFNESDIMDTYSGFVVAGELLPNSRWELLRKTGLPCVTLSFFRPHPNTVFVDYRPAMDQVALYLGVQKCRRLITLASCERESKYSFNWFSEIGFIKTLQDYNVDEKGFYRLVITSITQGNFDELRSKTLTSSAKTAFLAYNSSYHRIISDIMKEQHKILGNDYEIISFSHIPDDNKEIRYIDMKCPEIIDKMLELLYQQEITGEAQIGKIVQADFIAQQI